MQFNLLNKLIDQTSDGIFLIRADTAQIIDANKTACDYLGYTKDELLQLHLWDFSTTIADHKAWSAMLSGFINNQGKSFEGVHRHRDGHLIPVEINAQYITEPEVSYFIAIARDISDRKFAEAKAEESRAVLESALDSTADGILVIDHEGRVFSANRRFQVLWGIPDELMDTKDDSQLLGYVLSQLDDHQSFIAEVERLYKTEETNFDKIVFKDGRIFERYTVPLHLPSGLGRVWSFRDVTPHEQAVNQLQHEHGFLKTLIQTIPQLVWLKDPQGIYLACNAEFERFYGAEEKDILGKSDYDFVDRDLADFFREHDKKAIERGEPSVNEEWIRYANDGHKALLETTKTPMYQQDGRLIGVLGIAHDITKTREAEQTLLESTQRHEAVLATTNDGFWMVDEQGRIQEVNEAYCHASGYTKEELTGMRIHELDVNDNPDMVKSRIEKITHEGGAIFESVHRRKDGSTWPVEVSVSYTPIQGGRMFSFIRNITERKETEQLIQLRQQLSEMIYTDNAKRMLRAALDTAEQMTQSQIGFFHYVESDQETVSLQTWSTRTLKEMCYAKGDGLHYPVSSAGVWVDCIHERKTVIHNDYQSLPHKKGLPEGHAPLNRELVVPVMRADRIVAVIGVGNKSDYYDQHDVSIVERIGDITYDILERKQADQKIQYMAYNDLLTELPNRQLFTDRLRQAISLARRSGVLLGICYLDLDGFKPINDRYGHETGDKVLIYLAHLLKDQLREGDTIARLGGDEFIILLNGLDNIYQGENTVQRILDTIALPFDINGHRIHVSASIGMTYFPHDDADSDTLIRHADQAMYKAKESGKNTFSLYDPIEDQKVHAHRKTYLELQAAIAESKLVLHYQPRIDLNTGAIAGFEALVRWPHAEDGLLLPGKFLPIIENSSLEIALDEWVIEEAINQHIKWKEMGYSLPVSVNISPSHIHQSSFPSYLKHLFSECPENISDFIELEVLETKAIQDITQVTDVMNACAELGIKFSLDDFGTGYSSLTYFHRLPISILKIDQHFVRSMLADPQDHDIVEGVLSLANALKRPVVAEGVESTEIGLLLMQLGCQFAQGYGIARPMPADAVLDWLTQWQQYNIWRDISSDNLIITEYYDVNMEIFAHRRWLERVNRYIKQTEPDCLDPTADDCQFTQWYEGIGGYHFGARPQYAFIRAKHDALHALANELVRLAENQSKTEAISRLDELNQAGEELIEILMNMAVH